MNRLAQRADLSLSRLEGGIGGRGPGESKLESDRRRVRERAARLERELRKLGGQRKNRRRRRQRRDVPVLSIVGYTNAGKSTLPPHRTRRSRRSARGSARPRRDYAQPSASVTLRLWGSINPSGKQRSHVHGHVYVVVQGTVVRARAQHVGARLSEGDLHLIHAVLGRIGRDPKGRPG